MELVGFSNHYLKDAEADRAPGYVEETLESAGCTGGCPTYPGAPMSDDGMPDCSKCPEMKEEKCWVLRKLQKRLIRSWIRRMINLFKRGEKWILSKVDLKKQS